jgi:hypothetical protein
MRVIIAAIVLSMTLFSGMPAEGKSLAAKGAHASDVQGPFTLIYYGGRYAMDVEAVAFLDLEGDSYTFDPFAPEFDYSVEKGVSGKEALERSEKFLSGHFAFMRTQLGRILDESGRTIGFEVRPLYRPLAFGTDDVMYIDYSLKDGKVRIYIRLKPEVERQLFGGDVSKERD